jgi:hypothetical protein
MDDDLDQSSFHLATITKALLGQKTIPCLDKPGSSLTVHVERYTWHPPAGLDLPEGFHLSLDGWTPPDGMRRFVPPDTEVMLLEASLLGWSIVRDRGLFDEQQSFSYHVMRLLFQHAGRRRECFGREFRREADLWVTPAARFGQDNGDVLPDSIGLDANGMGERWSVQEFLRRGREAAIAAGQENPDEGTCIRLGLLEGARLSPFAVANLSETESRSLVRLGLFDLGPSPAFSNDEGTRDLVIGRLLTAVERHLGDTAEVFRAWFFVEIDNVIHQIAKRKRDGGAIDRKLVRQVFLELVFDAHRYMAESVHVALSMFAEAVEMNEEEFAIFKLMYLKRSDLGGLLLVMLRNRFGVAQEIIREMWDTPENAHLTGTFLRLVQFYGEMTSKRRDADRRYKEISKQRNKDGEVAKTFNLRDDDASCGTEDDPFSKIAGQLREQRNATCDCGLTEKWKATVISNPNEGDVVIDELCPNCGHQETVTVPRQTFEDTARSVINNPDCDEEHDS